jgi:hypothetical protein
MSPTTENCSSSIFTFTPYGDAPESYQLQPGHCRIHVHNFSGDMTVLPAFTDSIQTEMAEQADSAYATYSTERYLEAISAAPMPLRLVACPKFYAQK